ncbi:SUZ domain-containing protein 1 [Puma concolor]|uniref:SUZ domain-containing protein 1 n=1 Tax=Puma concolor TaxID=9696 RepID=A0A6P6HZ35_PUMCO|nr:SUZ domain-containing protein 1 [Puma concolor]
MRGATRELGGDRQAGMDSTLRREQRAVLDTAERLSEVKEIDRRLEKKLKITQKERKSKSPPKVPIVIQDDSLPTGPPPQIRILKRPTSNGVVSSPNSTSRPALPVKSLAQREAEYAEARKRILGSASPEEEQEKPILDRFGEEALLALKVNVDHLPHLPTGASQLGTKPPESTCQRREALDSSCPE